MPKEEILARALNSGCPTLFRCQHESTATENDWQGWDELITGLLKDDIVTLDFDVSIVEQVLECGFTEYKNFIPMISVKLL